MQLLPFKTSDGVLVMNSLKVEHEHDRSVSSGPLPDYVNEHGSAALCCHCRRAWNVATRVGTGSLHS
jgi:hypothetical protein